jgi:signal transduction histidine kinase/CheY-like chemotaxis protein
MTGRSYGIRTVLFAIVAASIVPALAFSAYLLWRFGESERARAALFLQSQAQGVAGAIDSEFTKTLALLEAVATVPALVSGDPRRIETTLRNVSASTGRGLIVATAGGEILFDTRPTGGAPPPIPPEVFEGKRVVSDVVVGRGPPVAVVAVPVESGGTRLALATVLTVGDFARVIRASGTPPSWIVSIVDRTGVHLARSHKVEEFAGRPVVPALVERIGQRAYGPVETVSLEGIPLISTVMPAPASGWHAALGLPRAVLEESARANMQQLVLAGLILAGLTAAAVLLLGRRFDGGFRALMGAAQDLGAGRPVAAPTVRVTELRSIGEEIAAASRRLAQRAAEVEEARRDLERKVEERTSELVAEMARREQSERQIRRIQKIESVGQLTGGIAHDFNNMLAIVLGSLELAGKRLAKGDTDISSFLDNARGGAQRAAALTRRLLAFSRQQALEPEVVDCNRLVSETSELLRRTIPENVSIETVLAGGLWRTHIDPGQLENALVNLASNARDAMPDGGRMTIETANTHIDDAYAEAHPEARPGQYVMIAVTDTGQGMDPAILERAFEPFVTTKPVGQGTGLGLSQVHGFIQQSGGHVRIYSEPGQGVSVKLYLPRWFGADEPADGERTAEAPARSPAGELILVVEDEANVRTTTVEMLETLGYRVRSAASGEEALGLLCGLDDLALLMTDIVMPGMNGRQLAERATAARPGLKVLYTTGYTRNAVVHNGIVDPGVQLIAKPFSLDALSHKVAQLLRPASG